jgi:hypothetical protein
VRRGLAPILASPLLCLGVLAGIVAEDRTHLTPQDVEPYHAHAKAAIESWPRTIPALNPSDGLWTTSEDKSLPASAEQLLHPNCTIDRLYTSNTISISGEPAHASLLIVQCKDSRDMRGHFPPICYPASGETEISRQPFDLVAGGKEIKGYEYHFLNRNHLPVYRRCVYDFFIVPGRGFKPDMESLNKAAADYQQRYYGAAQFQVVMDADYPQEKRETIFKTLIGANPKAFEVLNTVGIQ